MFGCFSSFWYVRNPSEWVDKALVGFIRYKVNFAVYFHTHEIAERRASWGCLAKSSETIESCTDLLNCMGTGGVGVGKKEGCLQTGFQRISSLGFNSCVSLLVERGYKRKARAPEAVYWLYSVFRWTFLECRYASGTSIRNETERKSVAGNGGEAEGGGRKEKIRWIEEGESKYVRCASAPRYILPWWMKWGNPMHKSSFGMERTKINGKKEYRENDEVNMEEK